MQVLPAPTLHTRIGCAVLEWCTAQRIELITRGSHDLCGLTAATAKLVLLPSTGHRALATTNWPSNAEQLFTTAAQLLGHQAATTAAVVAAAAAARARPLRDAAICQQWFCLLYTSDAADE